jgi:amino acid transporter
MEGSLVREEQPVRPGKLRRELTIWEAVGISLALMAPSMAANINPQGSALTVGRAVPLTFILATIGVLLVAYTFVRLCQQFHHAGSVYAFVGATLGPRAGVVGGWSLMGTYGFYGVVTSMAAGIFGAAFLNDIGLWKDQPTWAGFLVGGILLLGVYALAARPVRHATRFLLVVEGATVALILIVCVVVLIRVLAGSAPTHTSFTLNMFTVPKGVSPSILFLGVVFGFLSFAGFEAAATLGEEMKNPRRDIPRAILGVAIFGGVYFVFVTAVEMLGFGTSAKGVAAFGASSSLLGELGSKFIGSWVGDIVTLGTAISAFGCALACLVGCARLLFALSRDGVGPAPLASISGRHGVPVPATLVSTVAMYVVIVVSAVAFGAEPFDVFLWSATIGTLILLVAYILATVGAMKLVFFSGERTVPGWQIAIPIGAILVLGYTIYRNVWPYPAMHGDGGAINAFFFLPIACVVWIGLAVLLVLARPGLARRAGERLLADEGLSAQAAPGMGPNTTMATGGAVAG